MELTSTGLLQFLSFRPTSSRIRLCSLHSRFNFYSPRLLPFFHAQKKCNLNLTLHRSVRKDDVVVGKVSCSLVSIEDGTDNDEACELVNGVELSIGEGNDSIRAYLFTAVKNNNRTGILLLSTIAGFEDSSTRDFAYRVACNGFNVLVPDLFRGNPWRKNQPKDLFDQWLAGQEPERVAKDIDTATKWMVDEFVAAGISKKLGVIGLCYGGGRVVEVLAQDRNGYFGTGVSFYGTRMDPGLGPSVKVPVLFLVGDEDPLCPVSVMEEVEKGIAKGSKSVVFKGRGHEFAHRPASPEEDEDAEKAFSLMKNWLLDDLVGGK